MIRDPEEEHEPAPRAAPKPYVPLESRTGRDAMPKAAPMPAWARELARKGRAADGSTPGEPSAAPDAPERAQDVEARMRYGRAWQAIQREIGRQKGAAAAVFLAEKDKQSRVARAAGMRGWELDEEFIRLGLLYRKGAPLALRSFPPLGVPVAGASLEREERAAAAEPLFVARPTDEIDGYFGT